MSAISYSQRGVYRYRKGLLVLGVIAPLTVGAAWVCGVRLDFLWKGLADSAVFLVRLKPDWSAFPEMLQPALESVLIALVGTLLGTVLSLFFAFAAASNIAPPWLRNSIRFLLGMERALPEIVILLFFGGCLWDGLVFGGDVADDRLCRNVGQIDCGCH